MPEHRRDMVAHNAERHRLAVLLFGDDNSVAHIQPARIGGADPQRARPFAQGLVTLAWDGRSDLGTTMAAGVYTIRVQSEDGAGSERFVLLR